MTFTAGKDRGPAPESSQPVPISPISEVDTPPRQPLFDREGNAPSEAPYRQEKQFEDLDQWRKVRTGLTLTLVAVVVWVLTTVLAMCMMFAVVWQNIGERQPGNANTPGEELIPTILMAMLLTALGGIIWTVGQVMLAGAPERNGLKKLGLISAVLSSGALVLFLIHQTIALIELGNAGQGELGGPLEVGGAEGYGRLALGLLVGLTQMVDLFVLLAMMRLIAVSLHKENLGLNISILIGLAGVLAVILIILTIIALAIVGGGILFLGLACLVIFLALAFVIWFIVSLILVRNAVSWSIAEGQPVP